MAKKIVSQKLNKGNVSQIDPKRREEKQKIAFNNALLDYLNQYTEREQEIAIGFTKLTLDKSWMVRRSKPESSEVIEFPVNRLGKI